MEIDLEELDNNKEEYVKNWFKTYNCLYVPINDQESLENIYLLFKEGKLQININNEIELFYAGFYFQCIDDFDNMMKYYKLAVAKQHIGAIEFLATFYLNNEKYDEMRKVLEIGIQKESKLNRTMGKYYNKIKDYPNAIKHYLIAFDNGDKNFSYAIGELYYKIKDYSNAIKYLLIAFEQDDMYTVCAIQLLTKYYFSIKNEYDLALKYALLGVQKGDKSSMYNAARCYEMKDDTENMLKYYKMAGDRGHIGSLVFLGIYYKKNNNMQLMIEYFTKAGDLGNIYSMKELACYYKKIGNNTFVEKWFLKAIANGDIISISYLARHYYIIKNYPKAKKYAKFGIEHKLCMCYEIMGLCYKEDKNYEQMAHHLILGLDILDIANLNEGKFQHDEKRILKEIINYYESINDYYNLLKIYFKYQIKNNEVIKYIKLYLEKTNLDISSNEYKEIIEQIYKLDLESYSDVPGYLRTIQSLHKETFFEF